MSTNQAEELHCGVNGWSSARRKRVGSATPEKVSPPSASQRGDGRRWDLNKPEESSRNGWKGKGSREKVRLCSNLFVSGTWNVRTLNADGRINQLTHEMKRYDWQVLGLAETRWTGVGDFMTDEGHRVWYSGGDEVHEYGVAFMVNKKCAKFVLDCWPVSSRLIAIRLSATPVDIVIIQVYAPTSSHSDEDVEAFYSDLQTIIAAVSKKDLLIVQGDWNAKIGPDAYEDWRGTVGKYGYGCTNERGLRLMEFAKLNRLLVSNTLHPHKASRRATWHSPDGRTHNQIDFILVSNRFSSGIIGRRTRSFPGADIDSDHDLVMMSLAVKLKAVAKKSKEHIRYDVDRLQDAGVSAQFAVRIGGRFAPFLEQHDDDDLQSSADEFTAAVNEVASEVLGPRRRKNKPWMTDDVLSLCDERRARKADRFKDEAAANLYRESCRTVKKAVKAAKELWIQEQCKDIEDSLKFNNSKKAFETVRKITTKPSNRSPVIEDQNGKLLSNAADVAGRWSEYCRDLYNHSADVDAGKIGELDAASVPAEDDKDLLILREEVVAAVKSLKAGKAPGGDNIQGELIKHGGDAMIDALHKICNAIWTSGKWPKQWCQSIVIPIPKKGNLKKCTNYRTISLISHPSKVMLRVLLNRLTPHVEELLGDEQAGFRAGRSTVEQIFNIRVIAEKYQNHHSPVFHNFIDFKKAFDRVWHDALWSVMRKHGFSPTIINLIEALYRNAESAVRVGGTVSDWFQATVGVRQGCLLSPTLFNVFLEEIVSEAMDMITPSISVGGRGITNLRFADDIDLLAASGQELQLLTSRLDNVAGAYGMQISAEKSQILVTGCTDTQDANITLGNTQLKQVSAFKYLGAMITSDTRCMTELKCRIAAALSAMTKLQVVWKDKNIHLKSKIRLLRAVVISVLLYACQTWTINAEITRRIQAFEMRCYRTLLQVKYTEHRTNLSVQDEIDSIAGKQTPLIQIIRQKKLQFFGHIVRNSHSHSISSFVLEGCVAGSRGRGRPRVCWLDNIMHWTGMPLSDLLVAAHDRDNWRFISFHYSAMPQRL